MDIVDDPTTDHLVLGSYSLCANITIVLQQRKWQRRHHILVHVYVIHRGEQMKGCQKIEAGLILSKVLPNTMLCFIVRPKEVPMAHCIFILPFYKGFIHDATTLILCTAITMITRILHTIELRIGVQQPIPRSTSRNILFSLQENNTAHNIDTPLTCNAHNKTPS